jgi:hypothetical protein
MKKIIVPIILFLLFSIPALASTTDFIAVGDITVDSVTFGSGTADMLILNGSSAESWSYSSGALTITNPDATAGFKIGSADSTVKSVKVKNSANTTVACGENTVPGTSYADLPTVADTYSVEPSVTTDCESLCNVLTGAATYNTFPTCGAASCNSGYSLSGSGASASCAVSGGGISPSLLQQISESARNDGKASAETRKEENNQEADSNKTSADSQTEDSGQEENKSAIAVEKMVSEAKAIASKTKDALTNFITTGTETTKILGSGERSGVINSFKSAFGRNPETETDWQDIVKIANGRWPGQKNEKTEINAKAAFRKIYLREPDKNNTHDNNAIAVISYGLRPTNRNMDSEKQAIKTFKFIYGYAPKSSMAWDIVRAIAYSGAKR